jgi:multiple sugar transport system ATP-binding protein
VAGFIGSPAMNFVEAEFADGALKTPFGDVTLPDELRQAVERAKAGRPLADVKVIMGIRPEHFEDASLLSDEDRRRGVTFTTPIDVIESLGSDVYAYFTLTAGHASSSELTELAADSGRAETLAGDQTIVARLNSATRIKEEDEATLWFDPSKVHLFDPQSGASLLAAPTTAAPTTAAPTTAAPTTEAPAPAPEPAPATATAHGDGAGASGATGATGPTGPPTG